MVSLEDTFEQMLRKAHRRDLALSLFLGAVEGIMQSRNMISDAAIVDFVALSIGRVQGALAEIKEQGAA